MNDIAVLGLEVRSKGVKEAVDQMKALPPAATGAERAADRMSAGSTRAFDRMERDAVRASARIRGSIGQITTGFGGLGKTFVGGLLGGIAVGGITGFIGQVGQVARGIAEIGDKAKTVGLSNKAFQELGYVAKANRIEVDALTSGIHELSLRASEYLATGKGSAASSFKQLGITAEELKKKLADPSALFTEIIGKLSQLDKASQIRLADKLFGGFGGQEFLRLIDQGADGIRDTIAEAHRLGAVMDDDLIDRAAELNRKFTAVSTTVGTALKTAIVEAASELQKFVDQFRAFDDRATGTLKGRFGELQTRYGQLVKQEGTWEDSALGLINKDAATEMQAVKAEMDQIAAELRKRATPMLRDNLIAAQSAGTPYTPPPAKTHGVKAIKKTSDDAFEEDIQAVRDHIAALKDEQETLGATYFEQQRRKVSLDLEREALNDVREAARRKGDADWRNKELSPSQIKAIDDVSKAYARQADELRKASEMQELKRGVIKGVFSDLRSDIENNQLSWKSLGDVAVNALDRIIDKLEDDLIDSILQVNKAGSQGGGGGIFGLISQGIGWLFGGGGGSAAAAADPWAGLRLAGGGHVRGPGTGSSDSIPARLSNGEFVVNANAVRQPGVMGMLEDLNRGIAGFANGGLVGLRGGEAGPELIVGGIKS